ncbi:MAG: hypothetical protein ACRDHM_04710 [Actinomycetota bacterium]
MPRSSTAFASVLALVERAKEDLVAATPSPRGIPVVPLAEALLRFEESLWSAAAGMGGWRSSDTENLWRACRVALEESLRRAEHLRLEAPVLDYEGLVAVLGDLIDPLEAFEHAERSVS